MKFERYFQLIDFVEAEIHGIKGEVEGIGNKQSMSLHFLALDHARAIAILIDRKAFSSALALLRVLYESSIRGCWLKYCANEEQLELFIENDHLPKLKKLVKEVDHKMGFKGSLTSIHENDMECLCGFTHSGLTPMNANFDGKTYKNGYSIEQVEAALDFAVYYLRISFMELISYANNRDLETIFTKFEAYLTKQSTRC